MTRPTGITGGAVCVPSLPAIGLRRRVRPGLARIRGSALPSRRWQALAIVLAATVVGSLPGQSSLVVPAGYGTIAGNTSNGLPWGSGNSSNRVQQIYDSTHFTAGGVTGPILITRVRYRAARTTASWTGGTWPAVQIDMSSAPIDYLAASNTSFAANHGSDRMTALAGAVTVPPGTGNGTVAPGPWYIDIPLTTPFLYDPTAGSDLVADLQVPGAGWSSGSTAADHVSNASQAKATRDSRNRSISDVPGGRDLNLAMVAEFSHVPASGLFARFSAAPTAGASPLAVQFTDRTFSSDPGGVLSWAWDFDGDSVIDSTEQNPSWTYGSGAWSVSLTVTDASHAPSTFVATSLVVTDIVTPDFTWQRAAGGAVNFKDVTTPPATSWAWDFDEDGIVDSTAQNPTWVYAGSAMTTNVRLTTNRLSGPLAAVTKAVVTSLGLPTLLTGGNGINTSGAGNCFDISVSNSTGIHVTGVTMCPLADASLPIGTPLTVDVYVTDAPGGFGLNHTNAAVWTRVATGSGPYKGGTVSAPVPVNMLLDHSFFLAPGTHGMALHMNGCGVAYTTGTPTNRNYSNAGVALSLGNAKSLPFSSTATVGRVWNGVLYFDLNGAPVDFTSPIANAGPDRSTHPGYSVGMDGTGSSDETSPTSALRFEWTLTAKPGNSSVTLAGSGTPTPFFNPDVLGTYRVSLVVIDEFGNRSAPDEVVISTENMAPTADAGPDQIGVVNGFVTLDLSGTYDPDNDLLQFTWTITSAPPGSTAAVHPSWFYFYTDTPGTYEIQLVVNDPWGGISAPDTVRVVVVTPTEWMQMQLLAVSTQIAGFAASSFDAPGHQNSLRTELAQIVTLIQNANLAQARAHLEGVLSRTDGWVLRSDLDPKGLGQPYAADFIVTPAEQFLIYMPLAEALFYLSQ